MREGNAVREGKRPNHCSRSWVLVLRATGVMFQPPHPARDTPSHTLMIRRRSAADVAIFTGSALLPLAVRAMELALKLFVAEN